MARPGRDDAADASRFFSRVGYAALAIGAPVAVVVHPLALFIVFPIGVAMIAAGRRARGQAGLRRPRSCASFTAPAFPRARSPASPGRRCRSCGRPIRCRRLQHVAEARPPHRGDAARGRRAARQRARDRPLHVPDRRRPRHDRHGGRGPRRRRSGIVPDDGGVAAGGDRARGAPFSGARRPDGARAQRLRAAAADPRAGLRLYRRLRAADRSRCSPAIWRCRSRSRTSPARRANSPGAPRRSCCCRRSSPASRRRSRPGYSTSSSPTLPPPYAALSVAADMFTHDKLRLITGHGFATVAPRRARHDPAALHAAVARLHGLVRTRRRRRRHRGRRRLVRLSTISARRRRGLRRSWPPGFAAIVALAFSNVNFDDMTALTLIGVAVIATDVAARSQYRTTRPSAASLANL